MTVTACSSCGARIVWAKAARSRRPIPLDADPVPADTPGALVLVDGWAYGPRDLAEKVAAREALSIAGAEARIADTTAWPWHRAHFSTCPNADRHRSPR